MANLTKYMKLRQYIAHMVADQSLGDQPLMSEREMCREFGIARTTVRRALKLFIDSGTIVPRHGKGLFVNPAMHLNNFRQLKVQHRVLYIHGAGRNAYFDSWAQHVLSCVTDSMWRRNLLMLFCNFIGEPGDELEEIEMYHPEAVIWIRPSADFSGVIETLRRKIPVCVVAASPGEWGFSETMDYTAAGRLAGNWFLDRNIVRVLYAGIWSRSGTISRFSAGFREAFSARGLRHDEKLCVKHDEDIRLLIESGAVPQFDGICSFLSFFPAVGAALQTIGRTDCPVVLDSGDHVRYPELPHPAAWVELYPGAMFEGAVEHLLRALEEPDFPREETLWQPECISGINEIKQSSQ